MKSLKYLDASYNNITELPIHFWQLHGSLNVLHLEGNGLKLLPGEFNLLSNLQVFIMITAWVFIRGDL